MLDIDATLIEVHPGKSRGHRSRAGSGRTPCCASWTTPTRPSSGSCARDAGSNIAADYIAVLDVALGQLPEAARVGRILVRTDGAEFSHEFLDHLVRQELEYSVGYAVIEDVCEAIAMLPDWAWGSAVDADGGLRDGDKSPRSPTSWPRCAVSGPPGGAANESRKRRTRATRAC
jgi:hypothetical protein